MSGGNPNLKENWITLGYSILAIVLVIVCWPIALVLLGLFIVNKLSGSKKMEKEKMEKEKIEKMIESLEKRGIGPL